MNNERENENVLRQTVKSWILSCRWQSGRLCSVETQTTISASTAVDSAACNSLSLLGSEASANEPDTIVDVVEDQDCHFESQAGEEQSELSEPNDCLATAENVSHGLLVRPGIH